jgi:hypothetical protein
MRRLLVSSLLVGAAVAAVPSAGAGERLADNPPLPSGGGPSLPVCVTADVGGLDMNQLCKDPGPS